MQPQNWCSNVLRGRTRFKTGYNKSVLVGHKKDYKGPNYDFYCFKCTIKSVQIQSNELLI